MTDTSGLRTDAQKDPATLEREIDQTRAQMGETLGALEKKLSPGQLVDEVFGMFRQHGGELAVNLGNSIKQNPLPVLVTAIGLGWMMFASNRPSRATSYVRYGTEADEYGAGVDQYGSEIEEYRSRTGDDSSGTGDTGETTESAGDAGKYTSSVAEYGYQVGEYGARAKEKLGGAGEKIKSGAASARDRVADSLTSSKDAVVRGVSRSASRAQAQANRLRYTAQAQADRLRHGTKNLLEEQPLILGALGIAIGAAVGAALPSTEQEDRLLGPIRDKAMSQIKERGAEAYEQARNTAEKAIDTIKERATTSGSTSAAAAGEQSSDFRSGGDK